MTPGLCLHGMERLGQLCNNLERICNFILTMYKNVFISYAKEDYAAAESLYDQLKNENYTPWLDKKKLKAGANWDLEIKRALKESTFVILLLSSTSVAKRGYVQREYRLALEYAETKLEDDIYIIPVLLDKCEVPFNLGKFQWIEYAGETAIDKIVEALNHQRKKYLETADGTSINFSEFINTSFDLKVKSKTKIDFTCSIPQFFKNPYFDENFVNIFIQQLALQTISDYRNLLNDSDFESESGYSIELACHISRITKNMLSLSLADNNYLGGPRPNTSLKTLNFLFNPERRIYLDELIEAGDITTFLLENTEKYGTEEQKKILPNYADDFRHYFDIDFLLTEEMLEIVMINALPRYMMPLAILEIPLKDLTIKQLI